MPEDVEDDVRELKVKRWRQKAVIEKTFYPQYMYHHLNVGVFCLHVRVKMR
jgi:hypothetical protein